MAELLDRLFERHGAGLVAFDVVFAERDASSGMDVVDRLAQGELKDLAQFQSAYAALRPALDYDARFAASLKGRPVVLGHYFNQTQRAVRANVLPAPALPKGTFAGRSVAFDQWKGYTGNLPLLAAAAWGGGHINPVVDDDGVLRRVPLLVEFEGDYYEALSLTVYRALVTKSLGATQEVQPVFREQRLEFLRVGPAAIPVDDHGAALVPFRAKGFEYVPVVDVLRDRVAPGSLKDKVVLVGTSTPALADLRATPVSNVLPGVEVHASMIAGMLDQDFRRSPWYTVGAEVVLLAIGGVALAVLIPLLSALWATVAVAAGAVLITGFNVLAWQEGLVLPLAASLLMIAALYTMNMAYGYFIESRSRRLIARRFREYVPPEVVARMERDPAKYDTPRTAELTILFADVRGFTRISEALAPEALREYINDYLTEMSTIIRSRHKGTLDKYIGDAIMAFWGAPMEDREQERNAVLAALDMQKACAALNQRFRSRGWPPLEIGVGVNSGVVRVGDMGSQLRRAYTAMGDAVNAAARLEGLTKRYGVGILVGEATRQRVREVTFREVDRVRVKGREEAITVFEPFAEVDAAAQEELRIWAQVLRAYRSRNWDLAEVNLVNLQRLAPRRRRYQVFPEKVSEAPLAVFEEE